MKNEKETYLFLVDLLLLVQCLEDFFFSFFKYDNKKECKFKMTIKSVSLCIGKYMDGLVFNVVTMN